MNVLPKFLFYFLNHRELLFGKFATLRFGPKLTRDRRKGRGLCRRRGRELLRFLLFILLRGLCLFRRSESDRLPGKFLGLEITRNFI